MNKLQNLVYKLEKHHKRKIDLTLNRTLNLLKKLGNPQDKLGNVINVVGTNAKASMAYSLKSILNKAGYKCSEHEHKFKWNGFFVESGKMLVRVWQDGEQKGLVDETILNAGDFTRVKPGMVHQFEGLEDGVAFELYWAEFNHDDIVRRTQGTKAKHG